MPPKATQSPKKLSMWNLSRNCCHFLISFLLDGFEIVAKELMVDVSRPDFTKLAIVAVVRCFWFLNFLHPNMRWRLKDSNWVLLSHSTGFDDV